MGTHRRRAAVRPQPTWRASLMWVFGGNAYFCDGDHPKSHPCDEYVYGLKCPFYRQGKMTVYRKMGVFVWEVSD